MTIIVDASVALKWVIEEDGLKRPGRCCWKNRWRRRTC
jgi:hypothetical protein